ncbi:MAG: hypothetical protein ABFD50_20525 [Smithella sp.]
MNKKTFLLSALFMIFFTFLSCQTYKQKVTPIKLPAAYPNAISVADTQIAAQAYNNKKEAKEAFGFNIRKAGLLPVRIIFDNKGSQPLEIVPSQTFLVDSGNNLWPILDQSIAYDRLAKSTEWGKIVTEASKSGVLGGAAGAVIGAAVGIVTGQNVGTALGRGAAVGAAAGLTYGGVKGMTDQDVHAKIRHDLETQSLKQKNIPPHEVSYGFIFFPGEAKDAKELRLKVRNMVTGKAYSAVLAF